MLCGAEGAAVLLHGVALEGLRLVVASSQEVGGADPGGKSHFELSFVLAARADEGDGTGLTERRMCSMMSWATGPTPRVRLSSC